jgi:hypothetical protein
MNARRFSVEPLESRIAPATFTVATAADSGLGSLRQAILDANANGASEDDTIVFAIPGDGSHTIALLSALPAAGERIIFDGATQAGYAGVPLVILDGSAAGASAAGLNLGLANSVLALSIVHFGSHGIVLNTGSTVKASYIGVDPVTGADAGNGGSGVFAAIQTNSKRNFMIGGGAGEGNVIGGNARYGIEMSSTQLYQIDILGNFVGTDPTGNLAVKNDLGGISLRATMGGTPERSFTVKDNVISGNGGTGLTLIGGGLTPLVTMNRIGVNAAGDTALPNQGNGMSVTMGPFAAGPEYYDHRYYCVISANIISGNTENGVQMSGTGTTLDGNTIGLSANKMNAIPNGADGVLVASGRRFTVNGNTIAANVGDGIDTSGSQTSIVDNRIGTNSLGAVFGNGGAGIRSFAKNETVIMGEVFLANTYLNNFIANNGAAGILVADGWAYLAGNHFAANTGLAIDLAPNGNTANDPGDSDTGPNELLNSPVLTGASPAAGGTLVNGRYDGKANTTLELQFYALGAGGQPETVLGETTIATDASGHASFAAHLYTPVADGTVVVATANFDVLSSSGRYAYTSEFSAPTITAPPLSVVDASVTEGPSGTAQLTFTVTLGEARANPVTVDFATSGDTATANTDYTPADGTLTFAPGEITKTIAIAINGDTTLEPNEILHLLLSNPVGAALIRTDALGFIINDDSPAAPSIAVGNTSATESTPWSGWVGNVFTTYPNNVPMVFTAVLNEPQPETVTFDYETVSDTANGGDYLSQSGTVTFAPGETSKTITITILSDSFSEDTETFHLNFSNPVHATLAATQATGTILDNDPVPALSVSDFSRGESLGASEGFVFTISRLNAASGVTTVSYNTANGTAQAGSDYVATSGVLTFDVGETTKTVTVMGLGDSDFEPSEFFYLVLGDPVNGQLLDPAGTATIENDDPQPDPVLSLAPADVAEGNAGSKVLNFLVTLDHSTTSDVTFSYQTVDGTAFAGSDYQSDSGFFVIPKGLTSAILSVTIFGDSVAEENESFSVVISNPVHATLGTAQAQGTITNDDAALPIVTIAPATHSEGNAGSKLLTFMVSLDHASATDVSFHYQTADSTAAAGSDYLATSGTFVIPAGQTTGNLFVATLGDTAIEQDESFFVQFSAPDHATLGNTQVAGTITNDDFPAPPGPADLVINKARTVATWTDSDGDRVTLRANKALLQASQFTFADLPGGGGFVLAGLDLSADARLTRGLVLSLTAKIGSGGDGFADLGELKLASDVASIYVSGALGSITAGDNVFSTRGIGVLKAGVLGGDDFAAMDSVTSHIRGGVGSLQVQRNWFGAVLSTEKGTANGNGDIAQLRVGGHFTGDATHQPKLLVDGQLRAAGIIGSIHGADSAPAIISGRSIGTLAVGGNVDHAEILAGFDSALNPLAVPARIYQVLVKGQWSASDLAAGVSAGTDGFFGTGDDVKFGLQGSRIGLLRVGSFTDSPDAGDHSGIVSTQIATVIAGRTRVPLTAAINNLPAPGTTDLRIVEVI